MIIPFYNRMCDYTENLLGDLNGNKPYKKAPLTNKQKKARVKSKQAKKTRKKNR